MRQLRGEQLEERVLADLAAGRLGERVVARRTVGGDGVGGGHGLYACTSTSTPAGTWVGKLVKVSSSAASTAGRPRWRPPPSWPRRRSERSSLCARTSSEASVRP